MLENKLGWVLLWLVVAGTDVNFVELQVSFVEEAGFEGEVPRT
jgi:hypothetical protein